MTEAAGDPEGHQTAVDKGADVPKPEPMERKKKQNSKHKLWGGSQQIALGGWAPEVPKLCHLGHSH